MRFFGVILLGGLLAALSFEIYSTLLRQDEASRQLEELNSQLQKARLDQVQLQSELKYYGNPVNLEKELRARFNYREPGEKLIIIVPQAGSGSSSQSSSINQGQ